MGVANSGTGRSPVSASNATRALNAASCFLRFDISVLLVPGDQQTSDRSFHHGPMSGGGEAQSTVRIGQIAHRCVVAYDRNRSVSAR